HGSPTGPPSSPNRHVSGAWPPSGQSPAHATTRVDPRAERTGHVVTDSRTRALRLLRRVLRRALRHHGARDGDEDAVLEAAVEDDVTAGPEEVGNRAPVDDWDGRRAV